MPDVHQRFETGFNFIRVATFQSGYFKHDALRLNQVKMPTG